MVPRAGERLALGEAGCERGGLVGRQRDDGVTASVALPVDRHQVRPRQEPMIVDRGRADSVGPYDDHGTGGLGGHRQGGAVLVAGRGVGGLL